jgi:hypothetical protein
MIGMGQHSRRVTAETVLTQFALERWQFEKCRFSTRKGAQCHLVRLELHLFLQFCVAQIDLQNSFVC